MHIDDRQIHPELRTFGRIVRTFASSPNEGMLPLGNKVLALAKGRHSKHVSMHEAWATRSNAAPGDPQLRLCVYRAPGSDRAHRDQGLPGVLWIHGGGFALGIPEQDEGFVRDLIEAHPCIVVAPDYRLATEAPFPAAFEDCLAALSWLHDRADDLGVNKDQLVVGGDSAGGGLAAALCLHARDHGGPRIALQMPLYPMLDDRMVTASAQDNDAPVWNSKMNEAAWKLYLGELYGTDRVPAYAAPARANDLRDLPPAFTYIGGIEPFRDEAVDYFERMAAAGVEVDYRIFDGCFHGFDIVCGSSAPAQEARAYLKASFSAAVARLSGRKPT